MAEAITLHIEGMTCTSCAEHVQQALTNVPDVRAISNYIACNTFTIRSGRPKSRRMQA